MKKETRAIFYDEDLQIEAYRFEGITQPFPIHFHDYYVIGFIERGGRHLTCGNAEHSVGAGDILLFNPHDKHACTQADGGTLDYRAFNIKTETMDTLAKEITGRKLTLKFSKNVVRDAELFSALRALHEMLMRESKEFEKDELFLLAVEQLIQEYGEPFDNAVAEHDTEIEKACMYMQQHFSERISLGTLCEVAALSRATLVRAFAKTKGISPYRYLENVRLGEAKKLLEQGATPLNAAFSTGFSDQAHFTNFFKGYIGLTPKQYRDIFKPKAGSKS
ncbi:MAG: AraC family transcriptional regulator [Treponemataceae bacterium]|nr:AraC family transcriptional regulator [Treponemataceae bacterium]